MPRHHPPNDDLQLLRNALRKRLPPLEEARIYARLMRQLGARNQRELAQHVGVSQARISQRLSLLEMPAEIGRLMGTLDSGFTERHARTVRRIPDPKLQLWLARRIVKDGLTVAATEDIVGEMLVELGVDPSRRSPWSQARGLRWKDSDGKLVVHVEGGTHAELVAALGRFLTIYKRKPRAVNRR